MGFMLRKNGLKNRKSQRGFTTLEFIFGITLSIGVLFFMMAVSFAIVGQQIAQYISFTSARAQASAQLTVAAQELAAVTKASNIAKKIFTTSGGGNSLVSNEWYEMNGLATWSDGIWDTEFGSGGENFLEVSNLKFDWVPHRGVSLQYTAKILGMRIPFFPKAGDKEDFKTRVYSLMVRHPTTEDCRAFFAPARWAEGITRIPDFPNAVGNSRFNQVDTYAKNTESTYENMGAEMMQENACGPNEN